MKTVTPPPVHYPGICLRQLVRSDLPQWYAYLAMPQVTLHTSWSLISPDDLLPLFDAMESSSSASLRRLAIINDVKCELIGTIGFHTASEANLTAEIAYDLAPDYWGKGIASSVCAAVTEWSFQTFGFVRVQGVVLESNTPAACVLRNCGFQYEGRLRSYRKVHGKPRDFYMFSRLNTD